MVEHFAIFFLVEQHFMFSVGGVLHIETVAIFNCIKEGGMCSLSGHSRGGAGVNLFRVGTEHHLCKMKALSSRKIVTPSVVMFMRRG